MIAPEQVEVARRADLPRLAARYSELRKCGSEYVARCVFHTDRRPSLTIFRGRDSVWHFMCFVCGSKGDSVDFLKHAESLSFADAVNRIAGQRDATPMERTQARQRRRERERRAERRGEIMGRFLRATRALHQVERELSAAVNAYEAEPDDPEATRELSALYDSQLMLEYKADVSLEEVNR